MLGDNNSANVKFINLKQKAGAQEAETPRFWLNEKVNGTWTATKSFGVVEGQLNKAEIVEKDIKGVKTRFFILEMQDGEEKYKVTMSHGSLTYSLINSLASNCNSLQKYKLSVSKKQSKDGQYWNGQGYVNVEGEKDMQKWSIDPQSDLVPKKQKVMGPNGQPFMQNGKQVYDDTAVKAFWEQVFTEKIVAHLGGSSARPAQTSAAPATSGGAPANSGSQSGSDDNDDLPF